MAKAARKLIGHFGTLQLKSPFSCFCSNSRDQGCIFVGTSVQDIRVVTSFCPLGFCV